jgi:hypothetical protein
MIDDRESKGWTLDSATGRYRWTYGNAKQFWKKSSAAGGGIYYSEGNVPTFVQVMADGTIKTHEVLITAPS